MRMHRKFSRFVGGGGTPALGSDGAAGTPPAGRPANQDNLMLSNFQNAAGFPVHRVAVGYKCSVGGSPALPAQLWVWDEMTEAWYEVGAPINLTVNRMTYFDVVALADPPAIARSATQIGGSVFATAGSIQAILVVQDPGGTPAGEYTFSMGPDLTVLPV